MRILRALKSELLLRSVPGTKVTDSTKTVRTHVGRLYATLVRSDDTITVEIT